MTDNVHSSHPSSAIRQPLNGWLILDKPTGITSAHAVAKVKRLLKPGKIGHAGTLDPLASGVLPLALGEATKTVPYMMDGEKGYEFTVTWGQERDTDDTEGQITSTSELRPTETQIREILGQFTGPIQQTPPSYSAIKVDGQRSYDLARSGQAVELKARQVMVHSLELIPPPLGGRLGGGRGVTQTEQTMPPPQPSPYWGGSEALESSTFICQCGKGTYIRSLARDMGRKIGCLGTISRLRRTQVAQFSQNHAISLELLSEMVHKGDLGFLKPVEAALDDIPAWELDSDQVARLRRGLTISLPQNHAEEPDGRKLLARHDGKAAAICEVALRQIKPVRVFNL